MNDISKINILKTCRKCGVEKRIDEFLKHKTCRYGVGTWCKTCYKLYREYPKNKIKATESKSEWYKKNRDRMLIKGRERQKTKKIEIAEQKKLYFEKNKEIINKYKKGWALTKLYKITLDDKFQMCANQNYECLICKSTFDKENLNAYHVDHNHQTEQIRGILCIKCNQGLKGDIKDTDVNLSILEKSIIYLQKQDTIYKYYQHWGRYHKKEFQDLIDKCNNRCEICNIEFIKIDHSTKPRIDHNHMTGFIKGILCHSCNTRLGSLNHNPVIIRSSIEYLIKYNKERL